MRLGFVIFLNHIDVLYGLSLLLAQDDVDEQAIQMINKTILGVFLFSTTKIAQIERNCKQNDVFFCMMGCKYG